MSIQSHEHQRSELPFGEIHFVLPFTAVDRTSLPIVGGKAANLGELTRAGLPVPPGFCVTTTAYALVAQSAELESTLAALATTSAGDVARLAVFAADIRARLLGAPVPAAVAAAIAE